MLKSIIQKKGERQRRRRAKYIAKYLENATLISGEEKRRFFVPIHKTAVSSEKSIAKFL